MERMDCKIKISDETELDGLLNADAYKAII